MFISAVIRLLNESAVDGGLLSPGPGTSLLHTERRCGKIISCATPGVSRRTSRIIKMSCKPLFKDEER